MMDANPRALLWGMPLVIGPALIALAVMYLASSGTESAGSAHGINCHLVSA